MCLRASARLPRKRVRTVQNTPHKDTGWKGGRGDERGEGKWEVQIIDWVTNVTLRILHRGDMTADPLSGSFLSTSLMWVMS